MKNLNKYPIAFNGVLTKKKEQASEITAKTAQNFHFSTKKFTKMDDLRVQANKQKRKVVQLNYILSFIFNFVLHIIYIATFWNSVA